jgi:hypothetical protein
MPEKAEYWSMDPRKVRDLRSRLLTQGQLAWDQLKPHGFTLWHASAGWIGCWVERRHSTTTTSFKIQLESEDPVRFNAQLKVVHPNTDREDQILLSRSFESITSLEANLPSLMNDVLARID